MLSTAKTAKKSTTSHKMDKNWKQGLINVKKNITADKPKKNNTVVAGQHSKETGHSFDFANTRIFKKNIIVCKFRVNFLNKHWWNGVNEAPK